MIKEPVIAVIDDDEGVRTALCRLLSSAGMAVKTFASGAGFLATLNGQRPACALLDLHMPDVSGFDVLTRLAEMRVSVPVVIMTGNPMRKISPSACLKRSPPLLRVTAPSNQRRRFASKLRQTRDKALRHNPTRTAGSLTSSR